MPIMGLGLDHRLNDLKQLGAITYRRWQHFGLTCVDPIEANLSSVRFEQAFRESADNASTVYFDLTDLDLDRATRDGSQGFVTKNYTNAELFLIVNTPGWLAKTIFYLNGTPVPFPAAKTEAST